jgi:mRNA-degrading endonuclease RelE of RelBE toxin-antitoxin system
MDEIEKFLRRLSAKEQEAMLLLLQQLKKDYRKIPGTKALIGMKGWFRVRLGSYRIIFTANPQTQNIEIRRITRRNEKTYKRLK